MSIAGATADAAANAALDAKAITIAPSSIVNPLLLQAGAPAIFQEAKYYGDAKNIGTAPTGNFGNALMATLTNTTGSAATGMNIRYDLGIANNTLATVDDVPGHRIYYNLTGNAADWKAVGNFGTNGPSAASSAQLVDIVFAGSWANGATAQILWLDDNSNNPDGLYTLDNVRFAVPEPGTLTLASVGALGLLGRRRRR